MNLAYKLVKCPSNYKFNKLHEYYRKTKPILKNVLFNIDIKSYNNKVFRNTFSENNVKILKKNTIFTPFMNCKFISNNIKTNILTNHIYVENIQCKYDTNTVNMKLFKDRAIQSSEDRLDLSLKFIKIITFLELLGLKNKKISIFYAPVNNPKLFPNDGKFKTNNINSGGTIHERDYTYIILFRKEESDKVLLHELIHNLKLDFSMSGIYWEYKYAIDRMVIDNFNVNSDMDYINLFESLTDCLAIIFNSIFNSILTKSNIYDYYYTEILYSHTVANKIIVYAGFKDINDFLLKSSNKRIEQYTSVLSYYILKCSLMQNTDIVLSNYFPKFNPQWSLNDIKTFFRLCSKDLYLIDNYIDNKDMVNSLKMSYNYIINY